jgi:hypothetical protein
MSLGFGVLMHGLTGNTRTVTSIQESLGKVITTVELSSDDALVFTFEDGTRLRLWDDGYWCCEHRYMTTDDDLPYYQGATLMNIELRDAPDVEPKDEYDECHEVQFLVVTTNRGTFSMASHNEHNGYYGGFAIVATTE